MKNKSVLRMPCYYKDFRCTADKCSDNCCIGWEIDVDKKSLDYYKSVKGEFGRKLSENIAESSVPYFILGENERCPFLNEQNLCEIYINLGEQSLCEICTNHPRYYEWYDGITEGGIGLCCEAVAEIIVSYRDKFSYYDIDISFENCRDYDNDFYEYLFEIRSEILNHLQDDNISFAQRLNNVLGFAWECQNNYDNFSYVIPDMENVKISSEKADVPRILNVIASLEMLEEERLFEKAANEFNSNILTENIFGNDEKMIKAFENIAVYFVWRHFLKSVYEEEFYSKIAFAVLSTVIIALLTKAECCGDIIKACVYYSKEIEYSEQNLNEIFDNFYENDEFSMSKISSLLKFFGIF